MYENDLLNEVFQKARNVFCRWENGKSATVENRLLEYWILVYTFCSNLTCGFSSTVVLEIGLHRF